MNELRDRLAVYAALSNIFKEAAFREKVHYPRAHKRRRVLHLQEDEIKELEVLFRKRAHLISDGLFRLWFTTDFDRVSEHLEAEYAELKERYSNLLK